MNRETFKNEIKKFHLCKGARFCEYFNMISFNWCCAFVSYCMREIAHIYDFPKTASCSSLKGKMLVINKINTDFKSAEVGDIVLFETINPDDGPDHVGIVIENDVNGKLITLIEGNTGNNDHSKSKVEFYKYPYNHPSFDCIIDMSSYFTDDVKKNDVNYDELMDKIKKIKEILATIE